jgi:hypothetical protein
VVVAKDHNGRGILHLAAMSCDIETMKLLSKADLACLDAHAHAHTLDDHGWTPDDYFYRWRDKECTAPRASADEEEACWSALI